MGIQYSKNKPTLLITNNGQSSSKVQVINSINGNLQEYQQPIKASQILSDNNLNNNNMFLCSSEHMFVNCYVPHVPEDEELQLGHIYFIMPISKLYKILTLQELCLLAIKASVALDKKCSPQMKKGGGGSRSFNGRRKGKNGGARKQQKVDFQLALKQLG